MSIESNECSQTSIFRRPMPLWLAAAIAGAFMGGWGTYQIMRAVGYELPNLTSGEPGINFAEMRARTEEMMRQNMMRMMQERIAREQRSLPALVGKLDLLSNGLRIEMSPEQKEKLALALAKLDQAEPMTSEETQVHFDTIQKLLTEEQKVAVAAIELPCRGPSVSRGMGSTGDSAPGHGVMSREGTGLTPGMTGGNGMKGTGGQPSVDNQFQQCINQKQLHDFLVRLRQSSAKLPDTTEGIEAGTPGTTNATTSLQP